MNLNYYECFDNTESHFYSSFIYTLPLAVQTYINEIKNHHSIYSLQIKLLKSIYVNGIKQLDNTYIPLPKHFKKTISLKILDYNKIIDTYERDLYQFIGYDNLITFLLETPPANIKKFKNEDIVKYFKRNYKLTTDFNQLTMHNLSIRMLFDGHFEEYFLFHHHLTF